MSNLDIRCVQGAQVLPYLDDLAHLRITVFREFPYLYDGDMAYERDYLKTYSDCDDSFFAVVLDGSSVAGVSTAIPMKHEEALFQQPLRDHGWPIDAVCYFGESLLLAPYRGRGLGVEFFRLREGFARSLGGCRYTAFSAVQRPADHPLRPAGYVPLDAFWEKRGYQPHPELLAYYRWKDVDQSTETAKPMMFWLKTLAAG